MEVVTSVKVLNLRTLGATSDLKKTQIYRLVNTVRYGEPSVKLELT